MTPGEEAARRGWLPLMLAVVLLAAPLTAGGAEDAAVSSGGGGALAAGVADRWAQPRVQPGMLLPLPPALAARADGQDSRTVPCRPAEQVQQRADGDVERQRRHLHHLHSTAIPTAQLRHLAKQQQDQRQEQDPAEAQQPQLRGEQDPRGQGSEDDGSRLEGGEGSQDAGDGDGEGEDQDQQAEAQIKAAIEEPQPRDGAGGGGGGASAHGPGPYLGPYLDILVCKGFCNQLQAFLDGVGLARLLNATAVLPTWYTHYESDPTGKARYDRAAQQEHAVPMSVFWDVQRLVAALQGKVRLVEELPPALRSNSTRGLGARRAMCVGGGQGWGRDGEQGGGGSLASGRGTVGSQGGRRGKRWVKSVAAATSCCATAPHLDLLPRRRHAATVTLPRTRLPPSIVHPFPPQPHPNRVQPPVPTAESYMTPLVVDAADPSALAHYRALIKRRGVLRLACGTNGVKWTTPVSPSWLSETPLPDCAEPRNHPFLAIPCLLGPQDMGRAARVGVPSGTTFTSGPMRSVAA